MKTETSLGSNFARDIVARPRMYTISGSFDEVISFLNGYFSGLAKSDPYAKPVAEWAHFEEWLARRSDAPVSTVFETFYTGLADEVRLAELARLLDAYESQSD